MEWGGVVGGRRFIIDVFPWDGPLLPATQDETLRWKKSFKIFF